MTIITVVDTKNFNFIYFNIFYRFLSLYLHIFSRFLIRYIYIEHVKREWVKREQANFGRKARGEVF
jgi:hypothetical protein